MNRITKDPLLSAAHVILALGIGLFVFVMATVLIGLGAVLTVARGELYAELAKAGAPDNVYWAVVVVLLLLLEVIMFLGLRFVLELRGIVRSVDRGDPFEPANADRLSRMGWLTTAAFLLTIAVSAIASWVQDLAGEAGENIDVDFSLGGGGILLILTLFILARVFRQGAAMRDELEGTV
jgi:hypothetical protein